MLVCTTIVENGLDISNANTLIVEHAETLGLSQLHQLRGRVGRGRERGYAYFLYPPEKPLTETAHDRLATIAQHSELGAGMAVAMKDLEIRGAGNILGAEQSGHIAGVGFDLYIRLVGEAVAAFASRPARGEARRGGGAWPRCGSTCRSTRTSRTTTSRRAAAAGGLPQDRRGGRRRGARRDRRGADRPLRRAADAGAQPARGRRVPAAVPDARGDARSRWPAARSGSPRCELPDSRSCGCTGSTRGRPTSAAAQADRRAAAGRQRRRRSTLRDVALPAARRAARSCRRRCGEPAR